MTREELNKYVKAIKEGYNNAKDTAIQEVQNELNQ